MVQPILPSVTQKTLEQLADALVELRKVYNEARDIGITSTLGRELACCVKCDRRMLPRSVWNKTPQELRNRLAEHITRVGAHGKCASCVTYQYRGRPLTEQQLQRLRRDVGLI